MAEFYKNNKCIHICLIIVAFAAIYFTIQTTLESTITNRCDEIDKKMKAEITRGESGDLDYNSNSYLDDRGKDVPRSKYVYEQESSGKMKLSNRDQFAPLTEWAQSEIYKHQNPADCSTVKFVISDGQRAGLGSTIHTITTHLAYAIQNNLVLVWGPNSCHSLVHESFCSGLSGCSCLFEPLSKCALSLAARSNAEILEGMNNSHRFVPSKFNSTILPLIPSMSKVDLTYWWRSQGAAYVMRLNAQTLRSLSELRTTRSLHSVSDQSPLPFPLPAGSIAIHIRHGDKQKEMKLLPAMDYLYAAANLIRASPLSFSRVVYVSSDDPKALEQCYLFAVRKQWTLVHNLAAAIAGDPPDARPPADQEADVSLHPDKRGFAMATLLDLVMALEADAWIGTRRSNWGRLIDELRCTKVGKCRFPFVEVGDDFMGW